MSKDNLAVFINILDDILMARNKAIFEKKNLHALEVINGDNRSHI